MMMGQNFYSGLFLSGNVLLISYFFYIFYHNCLNQGHKVFFVSSFLVKGVLTVAFGFYFQYYYNYQTDVEAHFIHASRIRNLIIEQPGMFYKIYFTNTVSGYYYSPDRTYFFIKLLSLLHFLTDNNFWIDQCWFASASFFSSWYFIQKISRIYPGLSFPLIISLFYVPVPMFWTCGIIKESVCFSLLLILMINIVSIFNSDNILRPVLICIPPFLLLFIMKFYVAGAIIVTLIPFLIYRKLQTILGQTNTIVLSFVFSLLFILFLNQLAILLYSADILDLIYYNYLAFTDIKGNNYTFPEFDGSMKTFLIYAPEAFFQGMFMPLPSGEKTLFPMLVSVFNVVFLLLTAVLLPSFLRQGKLSALVLLLIVYSTISAVAYGFSTPNWGTLARYKVYYLPFLHTLILYLIINNATIRALWLSLKRNQLF